MEDLKLKGGALMIGSLLWQDDLRVRDKDRIRKNWRKDYLKEEATKVRVPIRYGRLSNSKIFTMVFSKNCEKEKLYGTAYIKEFKNQHINNWKALEELAIEMSRAEGMDGRFIGGRKRVWCTMSILLNPEIDTELRNYLTNKWKSKVVEDGGGNDLGEYKFGNEESAIKNDCSLNFKWFKPINRQDEVKLNKLDFLICTVTKQKNPSSNNYPSLSQLVKSIKADTEREYFRNNMANGISTFQDKFIEDELRK